MKPRTILHVPEGMTVEHYVQIFHSYARPNHVTWTTPHMRADRAFAQVAVLLEDHRREEAWKKLTEHLRHVRELVAWMQANPNG